MTPYPVHERIFSPVRAHSDNAARDTETAGFPLRPQPYYYNDVLEND
jgi:hypothetical protein